MREINLIGEREADAIERVERFLDAAVMATAARVRIVANGTFTDRVRPPDPPAKAAARAGLGLGPAPVALFLGSHYGPNIEAARGLGRDEELRRPDQLPGQNGLLLIAP